MLLDSMLKAAKEKHSQKPISPDAYHRWRINNVTRRLMEEIEIELIELLTSDTAGASERLIQEAHIRQATKEVCESFLNWKPLELESDED